MCQRDNPTKEQKTAEGVQWVFNAARKSHTQKRASTDPLSIQSPRCYYHLSSQCLCTLTWLKHTFLKKTIYFIKKFEKNARCQLPSLNGFGYSVKAPFCFLRTCT